MGLIDRILSWFRSRSTATESGSGYDGFLSYAAEWHALAVGAALGLVYGGTGDTRIAIVAFLLVSGKAQASNAQLRDAAKEVAYTAGGFVILAVPTLLLL